MTLIQKVTLVVLTALMPLAAVAQQTLFRAGVEARFGYQRQYFGGETNDAGTGFRGDYAMARIDGGFGQGFTYSFRHRLYQAHHDYHFWESTDWLNVQWADGHWSAVAGKQIVAIGGFEYDRHPIDLYFTSEFWNNVSCYAWGVQAGYAFTGRDALSLQICQSPFRRYAGNDSYAYNLLWRSHHGIWSGLWSANLMECAPHRYIAYLALGNQLQKGKWTVQFDLMCRGAEHFFRIEDFSLMGELAFRANKHLNAFVRSTYDHNRCDRSEDWLVMTGTRLTRFGGGVEVFPLRRSDDLRAHACLSYGWGEQGNPDGVGHDRELLATVGVTMRLDLLNVKKKTKE